MNTIIVGCITALGRNLGGWLSPALVDQKIDAYEWRKLAISSVVTAFIYFATYFPAVGFNLGNEQLISTLATIVLGPMFDKLAAKWSKKL